MVFGSHAKNIKIAANDSIHIFVEATINPVSSNLPYLVTDSLIFVTNGKTQNVDLVAYGQNANFYTPHDNFFMVAPILCQLQIPFQSKKTPHGIIPFLM